MKAKFSAILIVIASICSSGCKTIRGMEQWKCDHWGLCHFGIKPSAVKKSNNSTLEVDGADCGCNGENPTEPKIEPLLPRTGEST